MEDGAAKRSLPIKNGGRNGRNELYRWVVSKMFFLFTTTWRNDLILTDIFLKWVG